MSNSIIKRCRGCRAPAVEGRASCAECLAKASAREKNRKLRLKSAGCCVDCKAKVTDGQVRCLECRKMASATTAKRVVRMYRLGYCSQCWTNKRVEGASRCASCEQSRQVKIKAEREDFFNELLTKVGKRKKTDDTPYGVIYRVVCKLTNKSYIGQSTDYHKRVSDHVTKALNGISKTPFAKAIKKYGPENFEWKIIACCFDRDELDAQEHYYIKYFKTLVRENGYNIRDGVMNCH